MDHSADVPRKLVIDGAWIQRTLARLARTHGTHVTIDIYVPLETYAHLVAEASSSRTLSTCDPRTRGRGHPDLITFYFTGKPVVITPPAAPRLHKDRRSMMTPNSINPTDPTAREVYDAFEQALRGDAQRYEEMDFQDFFYGWLIGRGMSGPEAASFVRNNPVNDGTQP